jgi:hypothetical protein
MSSKRNVWFKRMVLAVLLLSPIAQGCGVDATAQPTGGGAGGCTPAGSPAGGGCTPAGGGGCTPGGGGGCTPKARLSLEMGDAPANTAAAPAPAPQQQQVQQRFQGEQAKPANPPGERI